MRTKFAILLVITGLFVTALSADVSATLMSENVRAYSEKIYDNLSDRMLMASTTQPIPVIVTLNADATTGAVGRLQALAGTFPVSYVYQVIPGFAAALTSGQIAALARDATVCRVEYDDEVHAHLRMADRWFRTYDARNDYGVNGDMDGDSSTYTTDDVVIVILDTGIDSLHQELDGGKVIGWKDFVNGRPDPYDDNGHGTHCASIAAGSGWGDPAYDYRGVAPFAALVGVKVLDNRGSGKESTILAGIDWVVANKDVYNIRVLSISLGNDRSSDGQDAMSMACNNAVDAGIVVCLSAGNTGPVTKTIGSPAAAEKPITVGAMCDVNDGGFYLARFSSRGPTKDNRVKPDICAPGVTILAAKAGTYDGYVNKSGTSMAAPFVAGTAALMLDADPTMTPAEVKSDLISTAQDWGPAGTDIDYGSGRLMGHAAVKLAGGYTYGGGPTWFTPPPHHYRSDELGRNKTDIWEVEVFHYGRPLAVTMIMPDWLNAKSPNFDLYLYNPSGELVAQATTDGREEYISCGTGFLYGAWELWVTSVSGEGNYFFDVSAMANSVTLVQDQLGPGPQGEPASEVVPLVARPAEFRNGNLRLGFELAQPGAVRMAVYDGAGRTVAASTVNGRSGRNEMTVGLTDVSGGVYFYRVESGSGSAAGKFAVIR